MSLRNRTVLLTRREEQAGEMVREIEKRGGTAIVIPMISIAPPPSWSECDAAIGRLDVYDIVAFTSANAVRSFLDRMDELARSRQVLKKTRICAVGEGTATALRVEGIPAPVVPAEHTAAGLAALLGGEVAERRILIPQGNLARGELGRVLREKGAAVDSITVYTTGSPDPSKTLGLSQRVLAKEFDAVVLSSPSAVTHFLSLFSAEEAALIPTRLALAAIGPTTRDALNARGMTPHIKAPEPSAEGVAEALDAFFY